MKIGKIIKNHRKQKGLTQKELGAIVGVSHATIARYESDDVKPPLKVLEKLNKALGCDLLSDYENTSQYVQFTLLKEICERLGYECDRYEYIDSELSEILAEDEIEAIGLVEVEYVINGEITIDRESLDKLFDRYIQHMTIDFDAFLESVEPFETGEEEG